MTTSDREQLGEWLCAYLDGELDQQEARQVEQFVRENADAQLMLDELRSTIQAVASLPRHHAPESLADEIQAHVERNALIGDVEPQVAEPTGWQPPLRAMLSMAAALVVVVGGWWFVTYDDAPTRQPAARTAVVMRDVEKEAALESIKESTRTSRRRAKRVTPSIQPKHIVDADEASPTTDGILLASASFEQKRGAGLGPDAIKTHAFRNETVRLQITVQDEKEREAVTARVVSYLAGQQLKSPRRSAGVGAEYFFQGVPKKNFDNPDECQVLVRASRDKMEGLFHAIEDSGNQKYRVALSSGPLSVHGWEGTRMALASLGSPASSWNEADERSNDRVVVLGMSEPVQPAPADFSLSRPGPFDALLRTISTGESDTPKSSTVASKTPDPIPTALRDYAKFSTRTTKGQDVPGQKTLTQQSFGRRDSSADSSKKSPPKEEKLEQSDGRPTLVSKRRMALKEARKRKESAATKMAKKSTDARRTPSSKSMETRRDLLAKKPAGMKRPPEPLITFVVEVKVARPKKDIDKGAGGSRPTSKPAKSSPKSPGLGSPQHQ